MSPLTMRDDYIDAMNLVAAVLRESPLSVPHAEALSAAGDILGRYTGYIPDTAPESPVDAVYDRRLETVAAVRARHDQISILLGAGYANLGTIEEAPWRLIRSIRLLVRCQRMQRRIGQLQHENAAAMLQLALGPEGNMP